MATTKLQLYKAACRHIGERSVASLTEESEARRLLDEVWDEGEGAVHALLEQGLWNFALRTSKIDSDSAATPEFGFQYGFTVPTDFVRLDAISAGEYFGTPLSRYEMEAGYIFADVDPIYMRYVSDDSSYGGDFSLWPPSFTRFAAAWLGLQVAPKLLGGIDTGNFPLRIKLEKALLKARDTAKSMDASQEPTRYAPEGSWASARRGGSARRDRGSRSRLLG